jgi:hypothetical protein
MFWSAGYPNRNPVRSRRNELSKIATAQSAEVTRQQAIYNESYEWDKGK